MLESIRTFIREGLLGLRLLGKLPSFLKTKIEPDRAKAIIKKRVEEREADFLFLIKHGIYSQPNNPYLKLLNNAGCEYGDILNMVTRNGLEGALYKLFREEIYLTSKELRGECLTVRGKIRLEINPQQLRNPLAKSHIPVRSSGSRSRGTHLARSLEYASDNMLSWIASDDFQNILSAEKAVWIVPGGIALNLLIKLNLFGSPPKRWFSQLDPLSQELNFRYRLGAGILRLGGKLAGVSMPKTEHVSLEDPTPILDWIEEELGRGRTPHLYTLASSAVRLARRAVEAGKDLSGVHLNVSGEPITPARKGTILHSGATITPTMGCVEVGSIGIGCLRPVEPDDLHLAKDLHAVIQPGETNLGTDLKARSLLFSSLRPSSPVILLNASLGDQAVLEKRSCGCPLHDLGLDTHLHHIRSFEKLTSGGMAFRDTDVIRILEKKLPEKFGGGPTDYQFYEDEKEDGVPHLRLLVHPSVGPLDVKEVKEFFLNLIGEGSGADKITALLWASEDFLTVEREKPLTTATGKIQHLHIDRAR